MNKKLSEGELKEIAGGASAAGFETEIEIIGETPNVYEDCILCGCKRLGKHQTVVENIVFSSGKKVMVGHHVSFVCGTCGCVMQLT